MIETKIACQNLCLSKRFASLDLSHACSNPNLLSVRVHGPGRIVSYRTCIDTGDSHNRFNSKWLQMHLNGCSTYLKPLCHTPILLSVEPGRVSLAEILTSLYES